MMMTSAQAFTAVDQVASDKEIDRLLVDLLRYPSPQTERLEDDPQLKKFIAEMVAPRLAELTGSAGAIDAMGNLIWRERFNRQGIAADGLRHDLSGRFDETTVLRRVRRR